MKRFVPSLLAALFSAAAFATTASAGPIRIQLTGLDLVYDGFDLYDAGSPLGGIQDPAESDPLTSARFFQNDVLVGTLSSDIYADVAIVGVPPLPSGGGTVVSPFGGFFDLLTSGAGFGIGLDIDSMQLTYDPLAAVQLTGVGTAFSIAPGQSLPFGLIAEAPIQVRFEIGSLQNVTSAGGVVTSFTGSGTAAIPEPGSLLLVGTGVALALGRRLAGRRRASHVL
jgi:hypothetical protein